MHDTLIPGVKVRGRYHNAIGTIKGTPGTQRSGKVTQYMADDLDIVDET